MSELISKFQFEIQNFQIRKRLDFLFKKKRWGQIAQIPGIRLIQNHKAYEPDIDCAAYALGLTGLPWIESFIQLPTLPEVDQIKAGDVIFYSGLSTERMVQHVGIMIDTQTVWSKWNRGPVYEHPVWSVPLGFGDQVKIIRKP